MYTIEEIKKILAKDYHFHSSITVNEVRQILEKNSMPDNDAPFVLTVGNLDIEIIIYDCDNRLSLGYICCIRKDGKWEIYDNIDGEVNLNAPDLEVEMFKVLSAFADKNDLSFFD